MSTSHTPVIVRIDALGVADANGIIAPQGAGGGSGGVSVLVECGSDRSARFPWRVLAVGSNAAVSSHEASASPSVRIISRPRSLLVPGMVNAHTHLDLTHIGPQPHDPEKGFGPWLEMIRSRRLSSSEGVAASVADGAELSLRAGVVAVGDIAGAIAARASLVPVAALKATPIAGISFIEFFAFGAREDLALTWLEEALTEAGRRGWLGDAAARVQVGVQPHAPYSVSPNAYLAAARGHGLRLCTHLAESPEERQFLTRAEGPLRELLESIGLWDAAAARDFGHAKSPIEHARDNALTRVSLVAHVNDASDRDLNILAESGTSVAYCPRASAYFGAERHFGPHRYQDMLARGINVALGTDSIVNLPPQAAKRGIGVWDEMRFLYKRDGTDPARLLRMGTTAGAAALGLPLEPFTIRAGQTIAGLVAVETAADPGASGLLAMALQSNSQPELLFHSSDSGLAR